MSSAPTDEELAAIAAALQRYMPAPGAASVDFTLSRWLLSAREEARGATLPATWKR